MAQHEVHTASDPTERLPATSAGEVTVLTPPEGLLVGGDSEAVESYLRQITENAGYAIRGDFSGTVVV